MNSAQVQVINSFLGKERKYTEKEENATKPFQAAVEVLMKHLNFCSMDENRKARCANNLFKNVNKDNTEIRLVKVYTLFLNYK